MLRTLHAHGVRHVIIGGVAGRLHGDPTLTYDLDITPDPEPGNLARLAAALSDMRAGLRVPDVEEPVAFGFDAASIARFTSMATRGRYGDLDIIVKPDGIPGGYEQLAANAIAEHAYGVMIAIGDLADLIAARRAAAQVTGNQRYNQAADRLARLPSQRTPAPPAPDRPAATAKQLADRCFFTPAQDAARTAQPDQSDPPRHQPPGPDRDPGAER